MFTFCCINFSVAFIFTIYLMIYDRHPELQSKWDKAFWARGYYVETVGNITDEAVQKYIKEQAEESRKEDSRSTAL